MIDSLSHHHRGVGRCGSFDAYVWFDLFDGMVISYEINAIKPEPEIYTALIDRYGLNPRQSIFIDDVWANLVGAEAFGFYTIQFTSVKETTQKLNRLLA
jgi:HAD superfamily hydrolase (TIGR01509 family)